MAKLLAIPAALCLSAALTAAASDGPPPASSNEAPVLVGLIDKQATVLELARLCVERTSRDELRALCARDLQAGAKIETLQGWLGDWHDLTHEPVVAERDREVVARLASPEAAAFETELLAALIAQRMRFTRCLAGSWRPELVRLCQETAREQVAQIATLRRWTCEWYGGCRGSEGARVSSSTAAGPGTETGNPTGSVVTPRGD